MTQTHDFYWHHEDYRFKLNEGRYTRTPHIHSYYEFVFVFDGAVRLAADGREYLLKRGDAALILPWQLHSYESERENRLFVTVFAEKTATDFHNQMRFVYPESNVFSFGETVRNIIQALLDAEEASIYLYHAMLNCAIDCFLSSAVLKEKKTDVRNINDIVFYTAEHLNTELDLKEVAKALGYSSNYLSHIIKSNIGINFRTLLNLMKFERAKTLLRITSKSMSEIAHLSGFGTERSFNRVFKALSSVTPREYRERKSEVAESEIYKFRVPQILIKQ